MTGNTFDNVDTGQATIMQIYNAYRVKHGLPFPDELTSLRKLVNLSATKMSVLLGLAPSQYLLYEKGDMPVDAVGRYIKMLIDNKSALRECIEKNRALLTPNEYKYAIGEIEAHKEDQHIGKMFQSRNKDNGYAPLDTMRTRNLIIYCINKLGPITPVFLNKLLFYTDFFAYRKRGMAMSGFSYRALSYGPVPYNWKYLTLVEGIDLQESDTGTILNTDVKSNTLVFSEKELNILDAVIKRFKGITVSAISSLSREEEAWIQSSSDANKHTPISFDYAFSLKAI